MSDDTIATTPEEVIGRFLRDEAVLCQPDGSPVPHDLYATHIIAALRDAGLPVGGVPADEQVERAAQALFEDPSQPAKYTWAEMVVEDPKRADIWRDDARRALASAGIASPAPSEEKHRTGAANCRKSYGTGNPISSGTVCKACLHAPGDPADV